MKTKRLLAIITALVVLASVLAVCFSVYAEPVEEEGAPKLETAISGKFDSSLWTDGAGGEANISEEGALVTKASAGVVSAYLKEAYDLGTDWTASAKIALGSNNNMSDSYKYGIIICDEGLNPIISALLYNRGKGDDATWQTEDDILPRIELAIGSTVVKTYNLGANAGSGDAYDKINGVLALGYKDGAVTVTYKDEKVIDYDASGDAVDFSAAVASVCVTGNWVDKNNAITEFGLKATYPGDEPETEEPEEPVDAGESIKGTKWENVPIKKADWEGDLMAENGTDFGIDMNGHFFSVQAYKGSNTIWTAKAFNLQELEKGFSLSATLKMRNGYNNYEGKYCSIMLGEAENVNLELRIQNDNDPPVEPKDDTFTARLIYKGVELANSDLDLDPNGVYEIKVVGGKVSVSLEGTGIEWTLSDGSKTKEVALEDANFSNQKVGLLVTGNYHPSDTYLTDVVLADLDAVSEEGGNEEGGNGSGNGSSVKTADTRNIVVPVCVALVSVCAAAFVVMGKKARA